MAHRGIETVTIFAAIAMLWARVAAQSSCTSVLFSLSPCLNYITGNSSVNPSSSCCVQLGNVVQSQPECLCQVLNGGTSALGLSINQAQAMALPGTCNVQTPPISHCDGRNAASPSHSPIGAPESPDDTFPSSSGSKTVPSTQAAGSSDAARINFAIPLFFLVPLTGSQVFSMLSY